MPNDVARLPICLCCKKGIPPATVRWAVQLSTVLPRAGKATTRQQWSAVACVSCGPAALATKLAELIRTSTIAQETDAGPGVSR